MKIYRFGSPKPGHYWEYGYDRSLRLWSAIEYNAEGHAIPQPLSGGNEAFYEGSRPAIVRSIAHANVVYKKQFLSDHIEVVHVTNN